MKLAVTPYLSPDSSGTYSDHPSSGGNAIILDRNQMMKMATLVPRKGFARFEVGYRKRRQRWTDNAVSE